MVVLEAARIAEVAGLPTRKKRLLLPGNRYSKSPCTSSSGTQITLKDVAQSLNSGCFSFESLAGNTGRFPETDDTEYVVRSRRKKVKWQVG